MDVTPEEWRPVVGYEGLYEVSDTGRVRSLRANKIMRLQHHQQFGYKILTLSGHGKRITKLIHVMVLTTFVGPRPDGLVACHNDGNPANNTLANLRWDTQSSNLLDAVRQGTHPLAAATHCKRGHEFTSENTIIANGWRKCRTCTNERQRNGRPNGGQLNARKSHCPQGHEYTPENTHWNNGRRNCRKCNNERRRATRAAKRKEAMK